MESGDALPWLLNSNAGSLTGVPTVVNNLQDPASIWEGLLSFHSHPRTIGLGLNPINQITGPHLGPLMGLSFSSYPIANHPTEKPDPMEETPVYPLSSFSIHTHGVLPFGKENSLSTLIQIIASIVDNPHLVPNHPLLHSIFQAEYPDKFERETLYEGLAGVTALALQDTNPLVRQPLITSPEELTEALKLLRDLGATDSLQETLPKNDLLELLIQLGGERGTAQLAAYLGGLFELPSMLESASKDPTVYNPLNRMGTLIIHPEHRDSLMMNYSGPIKDRILGFIRDILGRMRGRSAEWSHLPDDEKLRVMNRILKEEVQRIKPGSAKLQFYEQEFIIEESPAEVTDYLLNG
jgi:hypothetical protein